MMSAYIKRNVIASIPTCSTRCRVMCAHPVREISRRRVVQYQRCREIWHACAGRRNRTRWRSSPFASARQKEKEGRKRDRKREKRENERKQMLLSLLQQRYEWLCVSIVRLVDALPPPPQTRQRFHGLYLSRQVLMRPTFLILREILVINLLSLSWSGIFGISLEVIFNFITCIVILNHNVKVAHLLTDLE